VHRPGGAVGFNGNGVVFVGRYGNVYAYRRGSACYWRNSQRIMATTRSRLSPRALAGRLQRL
jgi:hypothetical protein